MADQLEEIEKALESVRPYLMADGGDVKIVEVTPEGILKIEMLGACGSCAMSSMTLKAGIEEAVKKAVPEIKAVEAVNLDSLV
ncbi:MAG: NifU family protein [Cyclobacteriaceae bacterium]